MVAGSPRVDPFAGSEERYEAARRFAYVLSGDTYAAEDLTQEALLRAAQAGIDLTDARSIAYVRTVVVNLWRRSHGRAVKERRAWLKHGSRAAEDPMAVSDETDRIWRALGELPPEPRCCIVLRYYEDLSLEAISSILQFPLGTVKSHVSRGLERIGRALEDT